MPEVSNGSGRNTATNLRRVPGRPFVKGADPRRNLKGRPRSFDEVRALAQELAHEKFNGRTAIEAVLRRWIDSPEPALQKAFVEYAFGKVPDKLETNLQDKPVLILHYGHQLKANNGAH